MKTITKNLIGHSRKGGYEVQRKTNGVWNVITVNKSVRGRSVVYASHTLVYGTLDCAELAFNQEAIALEDTRLNWMENFNIQFSGGIRVVGIKSGKVYFCKEY